MRAALACGLIAVLILLTASGVHAVDDFGLRLANFHEHYNKFFREYCGCPKDAKDIEQCNITLGNFNKREWDKTKAAASRLFQ